MLELVFVIVIIGILSTFINPSFQRDTLTEATNQIVSHIRYTQHLAMMDNKFDATDPNWFQKRWQIEFTNSEAGAPNGGNSVYSIFTDDDEDGIMDKGTVEMAQNPKNSNQFLTGWMSTDNSFREDMYTKSLDISDTFGITNVGFSAGCGLNTTRILFDHVGRPYGTDTSITSLADSTSRLLTAQCQITFTNGDENKTVLIEPETGYTHVLVD
jgi:Tfp pilus assembly protein FimT